MAAVYYKIYQQKTYFCITFPSLTAQANVLSVCVSAITLHCICFSPCNMISDTAIRSASDKQTDSWRYRYGESDLAGSLRECAGLPSTVTGCEIHVEAALWVGALVCSL